MKGLKRHGRVRRSAAGLALHGPALLLLAAFRADAQTPGPAGGPGTSSTREELLGDVQGFEAWGDGTPSPSGSPASPSVTAVPRPTGRSPLYARQGDTPPARRTSGKTEISVRRELEERERNLIAEEEALLRSGVLGDPTGTPTWRPSPAARAAAALPTGHPSPAGHFGGPPSPRFTPPVEQFDDTPDVAPTAGIRTAAAVPAPRPRPKPDPSAAKLAAAERKNADLVRELRETKMRLMVAETQIERLSGLVERRGDPGYRAEVSSAVSSAGAVAAPRTAPAPRARVSPDRIPAGPKMPEGDVPPPAEEDAPVASRVLADGEMPIATVAAENATLRTGPGRTFSALMTSPRGTKLAVETREGSWYRVIAPSGARAWIAASTIAFGERGQIPAIGSTTRVDTAPEPPADGDFERAFDVFRRR